MGVKKYFANSVYVGAAYTFSLSFAHESLRGSDDGYTKDKYTLTGYKPNLVFLAGVEITEDWFLEAKYRTVIYEITHESTVGSKKTSSLEEAQATELSFSLGLIF
ncbi:hypothetical protein NO2_0953 [Candidatus Termititenax persephonae]|uniref:Outer membrane protein beta-barrel domain-containing protein n=1 Tax=Candidatus Termititenax persephonae TaxID=2218525 RepID=A0A388THP4_9BACT|nr:hypothetical protein NO2_0953 [Candidatus Termititenax persephonae]